MAVTTVGAASLGPLFQKLHDQVTQSTTKLKTLVGFLQSTLDSVKDRIIEPVLQGHQIVPNQEETIDSLIVELHSASKLIGKLSKLRAWHYYLWLIDYAESLIELDRYFRRLVESAWILEFQVVLEQNREAQDKTEQSGQRTTDAYVKVMCSEPATVVPKNEASRVERGVVVTLAEFWRLLYAAMEAKRETPVMIRYLVYDIQDSLYSLAPLELPGEEMERLRLQMEEGVEVVKRVAKMKKEMMYECINELLGLNQAVQRYVFIGRRQMAKNAAAALDRATEVERATDELGSRIRGTSLLGVECSRGV